MNKKIMALAVASALAAPAVVLAQASNVQIFGTMYMEYAYANQGSTQSKGALQNIDIVQTPGSEIGVKGEEALGGGTSVWFQCASTADIRGSGTTGNLSSTGFPSSVSMFCGRNSAVGVKGSFGNIFAGNWDAPMKALAGKTRIVSDTGIWGTAGLLFGNSSSFMDNAPASTATSTGALAFSRRQNSSISYSSPVWSGFQASAIISTPTNAIGLTAAHPGAKARMWGIGAEYSNGPLVLTTAYEQHNNFQVGAGTFTSTTAAPSAGGYAGTDNAFTLGAGYQFGPVKTGLLYVMRKYDTGPNAATCGALAAASGSSDMKITSLNLAAQWDIVGPHSLRGGYTRAGDTKGNCGLGTVAAAGLLQGNQIGNVVANGGAGSTGASLWQAQYVYSASKRTEMTAGYVRINNDTNANYSLGGATGPRQGDSQNAFALSIKNTF